jgi:hypothetical protein
VDTRLKTLLCKKIIVAKCKEVKTGCNLAESSKEGYGPKRVVLPMMMMMMMIMIHAIMTFPSPLQAIIFTPNYGPLLLKSLVVGLQRDLTSRQM